MEYREQDNQRLKILKNYEQTVFTVTRDTFEDMALQLFHLQANKNKTYNQYIKYLGVHLQKVKKVAQIPFLPISFFKNKEITSGRWEAATTFLSSTTTEATPSRHKVRNLAFYHAVTRAVFEHFYKGLNTFHFLALLPSPIDNPRSSLINMIAHFIRQSGSYHSGFYLYRHDVLAKTLDTLQKSSKTPILWGIAPALLDFAEKYELDLQNSIVMETGGMKKMRKEMTKAELHAFLCHRFNTKNIHSEYGMTELLSQAYSQTNGIFKMPPWMQIRIRNPSDPFEQYGPGKFGGINIIDLANVHTCAFVETQDMGRMIQNDEFELLGRLDNADIRGCHLLINE